jgi:GntR family transcriptional regulator, transcriptional repressor for pyruvate dehydrogenase complex
MRGARGARGHPHADARDRGCAGANGGGPREGAADRQFHLRIAEASGNSALALVVRTLWDQRTGPLFLRLEHHFDTPALWGTAIREHRDIVRAIARHDPAAARAAMRRHMNQAAKRFSASWEKRQRAA